MKHPFLFRFSGLLCAALSLFSVSTVYAQNAPASLIVDDFESGVSNWSRNDKPKATTNVATLVDIVATWPSGSLRESQGAALFTFKAAQGSWASASRVVNGEDWAKIGAQTLTFWLNADGQKDGVQLLLRGRYRKPDGSIFETAFKLPRPIRLDIRRWRKVAIPLTDFKGVNGEALAPQLNGIYLLQFIQTGTWDSRFFSVDDIRVEGNGTPISPPTTVAPPETPAPVTAPVAGPAVVPISADFLRVGGRIRAMGNVSVGASLAGVNVAPLDGSTQFRQAVALLKPRFVRLDAASFSDLTDSARPAFDFARLQAAVARVKSIKAEPLIALTNPSDWGLDERGYAVFVQSVAKALNQRGASPVRYFEIVTAGENTADGEALALYNRAYSALKGLSPNFRVGGFGANATDTVALSALFKGGKGLDFLTISFFGATSGTPNDVALLQAARDIAALKTAAGLLDKSKFAKAALFVSAAGLSSSRNPGEEVPADIRLVQAISGAWWAQFLSSGSRLADQIFHNDAVNPEWGLLDGSAFAYPAYRALWLWNTFFPYGSARVAVTSGNNAIYVSAANTATAHNMLLINTTNVAQTAKISIRGFPVLREARLRIMDDPLQNVRFEKLPKSPFQTIELAPYAVAVVQFIEPPKR